MHHLKGKYTKLLVRQLVCAYLPIKHSYRYDGLYTVEQVCVVFHFLLCALNNMQAWSEKGLNPKGYLVCKFAFKVGIFRSPLLLILSRQSAPPWSTRSSYPRHWVRPRQLRYKTGRRGRENSRQLGYKSGRRWSHYWRHIDQRTISCEIPCFCFVFAT